MAEDSETKALQNLPPYEAVLHSVDTLVNQTPNSGLNLLLAWVPKPERQAELSNESIDDKATFTAETLGHLSDWSDATMYLHMNRPQDGPTTADDLGLTAQQATEVLPLVRETTEQLNNYVGFLIDDLLKGDLEIVASKLKQANQACGFYAEVLRRFRKQGQDIGPDVQITFGNDSSKMEGDNGVLYLVDDAPRDTKIESASYDKDANLLSLQFPTRVL